jgi:hypothetical protein
MPPAYNSTNAVRTPARPLEAASPMTAPLEFHFDPTPNPNSIKVTLNRVVGEDRGKTYTAANAADWKPAELLVRIPGVTTVFVLKDFITVSKEAGADWQSLTPQIETAIGEAFS